VRHTFEPGRAFEPWFYSIARSRFIDHLRQRRRRERMIEATEEVPEPVAESEPLGWDRFLDVLETLPAQQREAFSLLKLDGLSVEEAAERTGASPSALKVRAHRAYGAIRSALLGSEP
jgi:RNA polymerase sigma-70 factor, ECF subfamily